MIDLENASTLTNASTGLLAFGIDGPPTSASDYGRILNGSLSLDGSVAPVFEGGFTPSSGVEYVVATGSFSGTFATVRDDATADYSHPNALGLVGGAPATATTAVGLTSTVPTIGVRTGRARHGHRDARVGVRRRRAQCRSPPEASCSAAHRWPPQPE